MTDALPAGVVFASASTGCTLAGGMVTCGIGALSQDSGAKHRAITIAVSIPATATEGTLLANTANVTGNEADLDARQQQRHGHQHRHPQGRPVGDQDGVLRPPWWRATLLTYTIGITNTGPSQASGVTVTDTLPAGMAFATATGPYTQVGNAITWTVGEMAPGASTSYTLRAGTDPAAKGLVTNTAYITATETDTPAGQQLGQRGRHYLGRRRYGRSIASNPDTVLQDQPVTFVVTVTNNGPGVASGVMLTDVLPANLVTPGYTISQGSCSGTTR